MDTLRLKKVLENKESDCKKKLYALSRTIHDQKISDIEHRSLEKIREAIDRIDMGDYGICASCDATISDMRLEHQPEADYCDSCDDEEPFEKTLNI